VDRYPRLHHPDQDFGLMLALTAFAFLARLPGIVTGTRGITTAALKEAALAFHHWLPFRPGVRSSTRTFTI